MKFRQKLIWCFYISRRSVANTDKWFFLSNRFPIFWRFRFPGIQALTMYPHCLPYPPFPSSSNTSPHSSSSTDSLFLSSHKTVQRCHIPSYPPLLSLSLRLVRSLCCSHTTFSTSKSNMADTWCRIVRILAK